MPRPKNEQNRPDKEPFDKLAGIETRLYKRLEAETNIPQSTAEVMHPISSQDALKAVPSDWTDSDESRSLAKKPLLPFRMPSITKILLIAGIFFLASAGFAAYMFFAGSNSISTENVDIAFSGPTSIGAGEELSFEVVIQNQNNIDLEGVHVLIEYPNGTRTADEERKELLRESDEIGSIASGQTTKLTKRAILFGEANNVKTINVSIEYRVKDSSATYFKEKPYDIVIATAPVRLTVSTLKEVVSGKEVEITAEINSNSSTLVSGLMLRADYPLGFTFTGSSPSPSYGTNTFVLGDLNPADRRVIKIRGTIEGQDNEERTLRFQLGLRDRQNEKLIGTTFLSLSEVITIKRPFIGTTLTLDASQTAEHPAQAGARVAGEVTWSNNLPARVTDFEIQLKITGESLNRLSVNGVRGFYRSVDNVIVWDKSTAADFAVIEPGESGSVQFSFSSLPASSLIYQGVKGHEIALELSIKARRLSDANVPEEIISTASRKVRLSSDLGVSAKSLYFTGPIANQGPIPPKAERHTTYTVVWSVTNTLNNVSNTQVKAVLPGYVDWVGTISPSNESVTYNPQSREVVWDIGELKGGSGFTGPAREVAFQLSFVPSLSQIGTTPVLLGQSAVSGVDRFTGEVLRDSAREVNTRIADGFMQQGNTSNVVQ